MRQATDVIDLEKDDIALAEQMKSGRDRILTELRKVIIGQEATINEVLLTLFVGGNSLIVGVPGLAKTLLIHTLARVLELKFARIQFTPDLMPSDITGTDIIQEDTTTGRRQMVFAPGPIFANIVLADEINRTPPKTQSALLEAMQEHRVTIQGRTYQLEEPFYVFATQNPIELEGTYPLPEAQLDRFMFHVVIDHPPEDEEYRRRQDHDRFAGSEVRAPGQRPGSRRVSAAGATRAGCRASNEVRAQPGAGQPSEITDRARAAAQVGGVWRQRSRRAVPRARRQGEGVDERTLSRELRGHSCAGASGSAPPDSHEFPRAVRRRHQRCADRSVAGGSPDAAIRDVRAPALIADR